MDWKAVIQSLTETMRGAETAAKATDDPYRRLEAKIVSGVAASLASALDNGLAQEEALPKLVPMAALEIFARDAHRFSTRPCATCQNISTVIGIPWGCVALAKRRQP